MKTSVLTLSRFRLRVPVAALFLLCALLLLTLLSDGGRAETTWYVDDSGGADFEKIQDAVDAAEDGDAIRVWAGVYYENVMVNKAVSLIGNGSANTTIDGGGVEDVVTIVADWCNMSGFTVMGSEDYVGYAGIKVEANHTSIFKNNCSDSFHGIMINGSEACVFTDNIFSDNNCFSNTRYGIVAFYGSNNMFINNRCLSNGLAGVAFEHSHNNTLSTSICNENDWRGLSLEYSNNNSLLNNTCSSNGQGGIRILRSYYTEI